MSKHSQNLRAFSAVSELALPKKTRLLAPSLASRELASRELALVLPARKGALESQQTQVKGHSA